MMIMITEAIAPGKAGNVFPYRLDNRPSLRSWRTHRQEHVGDAASGMIHVSLSTVVSMSGDNIARARSAG